MRTLLLLVSAALLLGCQVVAAPPSGPPLLTPELARDALIDFIRHEPDFFAGSPLPERLAQFPIQPHGDGTFDFSAFNINTAAKTYSAAVGTSGPVPYFYNGNFELRGNVWVAAKPNVQHMHAPTPLPR